jgi:hypothetical protein
MKERMSELYPQCAAEIALIATNDNDRRMTRHDATHADADRSLTSDLLAQYQGLLTLVQTMLTQNQQLLDQNHELLAQNRELLAQHRLLLEHS